MNNTFNIQRFSLLLKRQWLEFGKIYLISLLVALGVIITFYAFTFYGSIVDHKIRYNSINFREPLFLIFGFMFISIISSSYFAHMGQKPKAIIDLMIPTSVFEKFLAGVLFTGVLSVVSFILIFYITDWAFISKLRSVFPNSVESVINDNGVEVKKDLIQYFFTKNDEASNFIPIYFTPLFTTSIFLLGSIYFNKFHYIKTAISVMIFSGIWTLIMVKSGQLLFDNRVPIKMENNQMHNSKDFAELWLSVALVALTLIFWGFTYLRLKEKEV